MLPKPTLLGWPAGHSLKILLLLTGLGGSAVPMLQQALHQLLAGCQLLAAHLHLVLKLGKLGVEVLRRRGEWVKGWFPAGNAASSLGGEASQRSLNNVVLDGCSTCPLYPEVCPQPELMTPMVPFST